jgi:arylformamidase
VETIDVSVAVRDGTEVWPGIKPASLRKLWSLENGDSANVTWFDSAVHVGTHVDAPAHYIEGAVATDAIPLELLIGPAVVVDATHVESRLDAATLRSLDFAGAERVLFKTANSELWRHDGLVLADEYVQLAEDAAPVLVERGVRLVGVDYISIGSPETHRAVLGAGIVAIEALDFRGVEPGAYELICLPVKLAGSDGAPARALLRR